MDKEVKKYKCEPCNFETIVKCNIDRHYTTRKHLDKVNPPTRPTNIEPTEPELPPDYTWEGQVKLFEKTHCKIINKGIFIKTTDKANILMNESLLKTAYSHLYYETPVYNKKGEVTGNDKKPFIKRWLSCEHNIKKYDDIGLFPPPLVCPATMFNMWKPFAMDMETKAYVENEEGLKAFLSHIDILCNHQKDVTDIIIKWFAQMIQYPAVKTIMPTFFGGQGGGKTSLFEWIKILFGKEKVFETTQPSRDCWGQFNELMANSFLVVLSELSKKETIEAEAKIKGLVTDTTLTINTKGLSAYEIFSAHRFGGTTNNPDMLTTKEGDRRNLIIRCSDEKKGDNEYFKTLRGYMNDYNVSRTIWDYLKSVPDMDKFGDIPLPKTDHQQNLKAVYRLMPDLWLETFTRQNQDETCVKKYGKEVITEFRDWCQEQGHRYETNASKLMLALLTLNITCPTTNKKAISENKHTEHGEQRDYDILILKKHYTVGCQIVL